MQYSNKELYVLLFSILLGMLACFAGGHTTGLVGLEITFAACIFILLVFLNSEEQGEKGKFFVITIIFACAVTYGITLYLADDRLKIVFYEVVKLLIFFVSAEFVLSNFRVSYYTMLIGLGFYIGLIYAALLAPYEQAENIGEVAKWVAPPGYVMLVMAFGLSSISRLKLIGFLLPIPLYGVIAGGARGSTFGAIFIGLILLVIKKSNFAYLMVNKFRLLIVILTPVLSMLIPVYIATEVLDIDANDGDEHTKSNLERSTMLTIALWRILDNPWVGMGTEGGYARVVDYFQANLYGYNPTTSLHNQMLDAFYFGGVFGFLSVLFLFCMLFLKIWPKNLSRDDIYVPLATVLSICFYMAVEPFSAKARTCDLLAVAACCISLNVRNKYSQKAFR